MLSNTLTEETAKKGISGSTLKIIAIVTMLIDHIGAALLENNAIIRSLLTSGTFSYELWGTVDLILRLTGRIAFPIFCFLLTEGFLHTRNAWKYALRLGIFCLISEIPFDLAFFQQPFYWGHQNVFFTLLLGLLVLIGLKHFEGSGLRNRLLRALCVIAGFLAARFLKTDYDAFGVCIIVLFYLLLNRPVLRDIGTMLTLLMCSILEVTGILSLIPIHLYNGKRGISLKYFFYLFYPAHLLILYGVGQLLILFVF